MSCLSAIFYLIGQGRRFSVNIGGTD